MDNLWRLTQTPDLHARWDLRFTDIQYLPRLSETEPQRFLYATRIGFGLGIQGEGTTVGSQNGSRGRTSALRFGSDDPKSLIRSGSGYWQYLPDGDGIRFLTQYSYDVRFGAAGRLVDRLVFRPLLGWATAWSFDRLRLWLEQGIDPAVSIQRSIHHGLARASLGLIWIYHGLIPKLLYPDSGELDLLRGAGLPDGWERRVLTLSGWAEVAFGLAILLGWRVRSLFVINMLLLPLLALGALISQPMVFTDPFNPVTLTIAMLALAAVGFSSSRDLPTARTCLRRKPEKAK